ncbi:TetR/AcrR family transcriptional regulator [Thermopolyspora sp. NPDC052614]|uniref:TetR/AcrR family transcriptional regulator n=1 Tax=Thermopolyspora sp. NPDC052614 TaxID=3155682 RepID=UPI00342E6072
MAARQNVWMRPERPARGPRPSFSRAQLTEAAIRVADAEGLEALTMRRVAAEIGAGTMSLYRYIDGKDDLIDLMVDKVAVEFIPDDLPITDDWRANLRGMAEHSRSAILRHPWLAPLAAGRQSSGPNRIRLMERALSMLDGLDIGVDRMLTIIGTVAAYVQGYVMSELAEAEARRRTGVDIAEWMAMQAPYIMSVLQSGEYPRFARMITEAGKELMGPGDRFAFGLECVLDGIAASLPQAD